jgi:hypothetical protein
MILFVSFVNTNIQRLFRFSKYKTKLLQNIFKKYSIHLIVIVSIAVSIAVSTYIIISIFSDNRDRIIREIYENERRTRDSLQIEIERIRRDGTLIQSRIDSLMGSISETDSILFVQLHTFKHDLFKDVRNYRDSSNSAILQRLRSNR